jgi:hypothetical protein
MDKKVAFVTDVRIVASDDIWPTEFSLWGFFMLQGLIVVDCPQAAAMARSSCLVKRCAAPS